jgi:cob(I)alamin adenosyltransferase
VIGGQLATQDPKWKSQIPDLNESHIQNLENWIDEASAQIPPLKEFILPGGHLLAAHLHLTRTICRRAERVLVSANLENTSLYLRYINRLSDMLFTAARLANHLSHISDIPWKK